MPAETTTDVLATLDRLADVAESFVDICDELQWAKGDLSDAFADGTPLAGHPARHVLDAAAWDVITDVTTDGSADSTRTAVRRLRGVIAIARAEESEA